MLSHLLKGNRAGPVSARMVLWLHVQEAETTLCDNSLIDLRETKYGTEEAPHLCCVRRDGLWFSKKLWLTHGFSTRLCFSLVFPQLIWARGRLVV